jgi:hypothetical protein
VSGERRNLAVAVALLALSFGYLIWARNYPEANALVPTLVAWVAIGLCALDVAAHLPAAWGRRIGAVLSGRAHREAEGDLALRRDELLAMGWMALGLAIFALLGLLAGMGVYVLGYMTLHGRLGLRLGAAVAAGAVAATWLVFAVALRFELYPGLLFGG